jgi:hypothetical protein
VPIDVVVRQHPCGDVVANLAEAIESVPPPKPPTALAFPFLPDGADARFPLLRGVEPYGSTCFNRRQADLLMAELDDLEQCGADTLRSQVRALKVLIAVQMAAQHRYLWFLGD